MDSCLAASSPAGSVCGTLGLTGSSWPARWLLMGHHSGHVGREALHPRALELRVPGQLPSCPWWIAHARAVTEALLVELKKHQARGCCSWHFCLLGGFVRTLRAAKEIRSSQEEQKGMGSFESGRAVGGCVCRWMAELPPPRAPLEPGESFLPSWGPVRG